MGLIFEIFVTPKRAPAKRRRFSKVVGGRLVQCPRVQLGATDRAEQTAGRSSGLCR
jgi:hypothetical protein